MYSAGCRKEGFKKKRWSPSSPVPWGHVGRVRESVGVEGVVAARGAFRGVRAALGDSVVPGNFTLGGIFYCFQSAP